MKNHLFCATQTALAASIVALSQPALAQDFIKGGEEKFTLNLGGIVNQFDTSVGLNGGGLRGTPIDLEGNGLQKSLSSLQVSGTWRVTERNRVDALYFGAKRSGSRTYARDITVGGQVIPVGFTVSAEAQDQFLVADYRYSFLKSETLELAGLVGLYGGWFDFKVSASGTRPGAASPVTIGSSSSTTVPLPVIGASLDWYIQPRWKASTSLAGMSAHIGSVDGSITVFQLGTDYMFTRNWGVGAAYMYAKLNADVTKSGFNGNLNWSNNSVMVYGTAKF
jgi:opacity protein-like surface antigen